MQRKLAVGVVDDGIVMLEFAFCYPLVFEVALSFGLTPNVPCDNKYKCISQGISSKFYLQISYLYDCCRFVLQVRFRILFRLHNRCALSTNFPYVFSLLKKLSIVKSFRL